MFRHSQRILEKDLAPLAKVGGLQKASLAALEPQIKELLKKVPHESLFMLQHPSPSW